MDVEILVHISAPTTHKDDEKYRDMANAYAAFEDVQPSSSNLLGTSAVIPNHSTAEASQENITSRSIPRSSKLTSKGPPISTTPGDLDSERDIINESDDAYGSFPSVTFAPVPGGDRKPNNSFTSIDESQSPPGSRLEQLERIQDRWKRSILKSSAAKGGHDGEIRSTKSPTDDTPLFIEDTQVYDGVLTSYPSDSELSFRTGDPAQEYIRIDRPPIPPEPVHAANLHNGIPPVQIPLDSFPTDEETWELVEQQIQYEQGQYVQSTGPVEGTGDDGPIDFSTLPSEVFAPPPPVSTEKPGSLPSQITDELELIHQQNKSRFQPERRLRGLEADERGYWVIDASSWSRRAQYDFWSSLCEHVRQGRFGWGVTLYREHQDSEGDCRVYPTELGAVRLYCWGEIVEQVWLYIWLCSDGKVAGTKSRWVDADDMPVIQMP
jgi:hypothetical protein